MPVDRLLESHEDEQGRRHLDLVEVNAYSAAADTVRDLPASARTFALLVLGDATGIPVDSLSALAEASMERGIYWLSAWGPDCGRVHDIFDEVAVGDGTTESVEVITTWHDDEPLGEALSFFWHSARPYEGQERGPLMLVLAVADPNSAAEVRRRAAGGLPAE